MGGSHCLQAGTALSRDWLVIQGVGSRHSLWVRLVRPSSERFSKAEGSFLNGHYFTAALLTKYVLLSCYQLFLVATALRTVLHLSIHGSLLER